MNKAALLATAAVAALAASGASAASRPASSVRIKPSHVHVLPHPGASVLYDQSSGSNGIGIISQNFEPTFSAYDSAGADDFTLPATGKVKEVQANGIYFNGSGPALAFDVIFYSKIKKGQATVLANCKGEGYTDLAFGYPDIALQNCDGELKFKAGKQYWVSVVADLDTFVGGQWAWNTNDEVNGNKSLWENPAGGFSTSGCTTWTRTTLCIPSGEGPDFAFALLGR